MNGLTDFLKKTSKWREKCTERFCQKIFQNEPGLYFSFTFEIERVWANQSCCYSRFSRIVTLLHAFRVVITVTAKFLTICESKPVKMQAKRFCAAAKLQTNIWRWWWRLGWFRLMRMRVILSLRINNLGFKGLKRCKSYWEEPVRNSTFPSVYSDRLQETIPFCKWQNRAPEMVCELGMGE